MLAAVVGTFFVMSIGMLMAHAVDAFRNLLPQISGRSKQTRVHFNR